MTPSVLLETPRLRLRPHRVEDFGQMMRLWTDETVTRFIGGRPHLREEIWQRLLRYVGHWQCQGFGYFVLEELATGRYAGEIGLIDFKRSLPARYDGIPEIGWILHPDFHGLGYASEAIGTILGWRDRQLPGDETFAIIDPQNTASLKVANRAGMRVVEEVLFHDKPTLMLLRDRSGLASG